MFAKSLVAAEGMALIFTTEWHRPAPTLGGVSMHRSLRRCRLTSPERGYGAAPPSAWRLKKVDVARGSLIDIMVEPLRNATSTSVLTGERPARFPASHHRRRLELKLDQPLTREF